MRIFYLVIILFLSTQLNDPCAAQINLPGEFVRDLQRFQLRFDKPPDALFASVPVKKNPHMDYSIGYRAKATKLEIRYAMRDASSVMLAKVITEAVIMNISLTHNAQTPKIGIGDSANADKIPGAGMVVTNIMPMGINPPIEEYDPQAVKKEFNADWGATSAFQPMAGFAEGFDMCMLSAIYSKGRGLAFVFYLFDHKDFESGANRREFEAAFHALRFR